VTNRWAASGLGLAALCALAQLSPAAGSLLELSRPALASGECWRLLTGHLVHWSWAHLFWDALPLVTLSGIIGARSPARLIACLAGAALVVPLAVLLSAPQISTYRGLSGVDAGLYVLGGRLLVREHRRAGRRISLAAVRLALAGFIAKVLYEAATGGGVFVDVQAVGVVTVPIAHVAGGAVGWLCGGQPGRASPDWRILSA